jgi:fructose 1,6-bisphosphate aldolase/phosphatase
MFDDPGYDRARDEANLIGDYLRKHGPFEPHRLPLDEMEYTTMPAVAAKMANRWEEIKDAAEKQKIMAAPIAEVE